MKPNKKTKPIKSKKVRTVKKRTVVRKAPAKSVRRQTLPPLVEAIVRGAFSKKARDVTVLALSNLTDIADYFVICSGDSSVQLKAIGEAIEAKTKEIGEKPWHIELPNEPSWVLMDYVNVVVHIFDPKTRLYYDLERLWGDAPAQVCLPEDYD